MKTIGLSMAVGLALTASAWANSPTAPSMPGQTANQQVLPETNTRDGDGSGLGISDPLPPDVDNLNTGESGASGAVGTATGTTDPRYHERNMGRRGVKTSTSTSTATSTNTNMNTNLGVPNNY